MNKREINAGIVGLGFGNIHFNTLRKIRLCKRIFLCDFKKKFFLQKFKKNKFKFYKKFKDLLLNQEINLVCIASYDNYHFEHIIKCIKKKINIFVEKPFCQSFKQYNKIKKLLLKENVHFSSNFVLRKHPKFLKIFKIVNAGKIGKIYHLEGEYNYGRIKKITSGWRAKIPYYSVTQGGAIHIIDLFCCLIKSLPTKVIANGNKIMTRNTKFKYLDNVNALLDFENGVTAKLSSNFGCVMPHDHTLRIFGTKGSIILQNDNIYFFNSRDQKKPKIIKFKIDKKKKYKSIHLKEFVFNLYKNKKRNPATLVETMASMATCLSIDKSIKTKKWETVKI